MVTSGMAVTRSWPATVASYMNTDHMSKICGGKRTKNTTKTDMQLSPSLLVGEASLLKESTGEIGTVRRNRNS